MNPQINDLFQFTRSERRGIVICLFVVIILFLFPRIYASFLYQKTASDYSVFEQEIDTWEANLVRKDSIRKQGFTTKNYTRNYEKTKTAYVKKSIAKDAKPKPKKSNATFKPVVLQPTNFNPNTASVALLKTIGLPDKTIRILINYREKGGKFYKKEDLKKVYGFKEEWYETLAPYIQIEQKREKTNKVIAEKRPKSYESQFKEQKPSSFNAVKSKADIKVKSKKKKPVYKPVVVNINTATAADFKKIYGIGTKYSERMVKFRDKLGGYASIEQIGEIYGLPDSVFQKIKPSLMLGTPALKKVNINTASVEEFKAHPYLKWKIAKAIVKYREMHGKFETIEDLQKCHAVSAENYKKISPYLSVN